MRHAGRIADWNDDKGYGFVAPHDGGVRAFVHVSALQRGSRRPVDGDLVSYALVQDARGRWNARDVRFAGERIRTEPARARRGRATSWPRKALASAALATVAAAVALDALPLAIAAWIAVASGVSYLLYVADKAAAERGAWRTPESTLHLVDLLGGWPGALVAQQQYRHKTAKASFQAVFWITVVLNVFGVAWLAWSGTGHGIARALGL